MMKGMELPPNLDLTQLAEHKELVKRRIYLQLKFEHITKPWHLRLGANGRSVVLVPKVDLAIDGEPKICMKASTKGMKLML
jgi:hypothetical protein